MVAAIEGGAADSVQVTVEQSAALMTISAGDAQSAAAGTAVAVKPAVTVKDASGVPVAGVAVEFAVASGGGSISGASAVTDASGVATAGVWTLGPQPGENTLRASATGAGSVTFTATATTGAASAISIQGGDGGSAEVASSRVIEAKVVDANSNPVSGYMVNWAVASGGGSLSAASSVTDASGVAAITWTFGTTAGSQSATATGAGLTDSPRTYTVTTTAAAAAQLGLTTQASDTVMSGVNFTRQPVVQVQDMYGNPVAQSGASVVATIWSGGGTLSGTNTLVTDASGTATYTDLSITGTVGPRELRFAAVELAAATSDTIWVEAGPAASLASDGGEGQSAAAGSAVATAPSVLVTDASGNAVAGVAVTFAVASGGGSVTGASATTDGSGVASVGSWTLGTTAGANTLTASSAGLTSVTFNATGTAGTAAAAQSTATPTPASVTADGTSTSTIMVQAKDQYGNDLSSGGANVVLNADAEFMGPVSDNNNGTYSATYTAPTTSGTATISATLNTATLPNATITLVPGAASQYLVTSSTAAPVAGAEVTITAQLADANGNAVTTSGLTVTWSSTTTGGAGVFLAASSTTDASGIATVVFATSTTSGTDHAFTGTDGGSLTGISGTITTQAGPASTATSTIAADPTSIANTSGTSMITVQLKDAFGNDLTTDVAAISFTTTSAGGSFSTTVYNGNGSYTATYTAGAAGSDTVGATIDGATITNTVVITVS